MSQGLPYQHLGADTNGILQGVGQIVAILLSLQAILWRRMYSWGSNLKSCAGSFTDR